VLIDAGAEVRLYAGDMTRTLPVSGAFGPEQRALYELVESARREAVESIAPGVPADRPHRRAGLVLTRGLVELGLLQGEPEALFESGAHRRFYPHQTSHWLGLDTHDPGDYAVDGSPRVLEPGMVLTVEPGLYFPPWGEPECPAPYRGLGFRIEDTVLVTDGGPDILTAGFPTDPDAVQALVGGGG
jgi:Xaa-Pro aminopeptidase